MLKNIIYVVILAVISFFAATQFSAQLEAVSAARARKAGKRRSLELGFSGRAIIAVALLAVMLLLGLMSNIMLLSTIVSLVLFAGLVVANVYLKGNGISVFPSLFLIWVGLAIAAQKNAYLVVGDIWGTIYSIISIVLLILMIAVTVVGNINAKYRKVRKERRDAEELDMAVEAKSEEFESKEDDSEEEATECDEDDEDEEDDPFDGEDPFHEEFWTKAIKIGGFVLLFVAAFVLAYWLEAKFDFFPPYVR